MREEEVLYVDGTHPDGIGRTRLIPFNYITERPSGMAAFCYCAFTHYGTKSEKCARMPSVSQALPSSYFVSDVHARHLSFMRFLAISGSLRSRSTNTSLLRALTKLAPPELEIVVYEGLDQIPPFNPEREADSLFGPVAHFRTALEEAAAVLFSTPEYAHGLPGTLKNALDWVVGSGELSRKPVVLINASSRGTYAQASLKEILVTMDANLLQEAEVTVDILGKNYTPTEIAQNPEFSSVLRASLRSVVEVCVQEQTKRDQAGSLVQPATEN